MPNCRCDYIQRHNFKQFNLLGHAKQKSVTEVLFMVQDSAKLSLKMFSQCH